MKLALGRIISTLLVAAGWVLFGIKIVLDLIGYSTAPEDLEIAQTRLEQALDFVLATPWWAILGFALVTTLWLMWVSWPKRWKTLVNSMPQTKDGDDIQYNNMKETIVGKSFRHETVIIDGKSFRKCDFEAVRIQYNGTGFVDFEECSFAPPIEFRFGNEYLTAAAFLQQFAMALKENAEKGGGPVNLPR